MKFPTDLTSNSLSSQECQRTYTERPARPGGRRCSCPGCSSESPQLPGDPARGRTSGVPAGAHRVHRAAERASGRDASAREAGVVVVAGWNDERACATEAPRQGP